MKKQAGVCSFTIEVAKLPALDEERILIVNLGGRRRACNILRELLDWRLGHRERAFSSCQICRRCGTGHGSFFSPFR